MCRTLEIVFRWFYFFWFFPCSFFPTCRNWLIWEEICWPYKAWYWCHISSHLLQKYIRQQKLKCLPWNHPDFFFQICNTLYIISKQTIKSIYIIHPHSRILGPGNDATDGLFYKLLVTKIKRKHFGTCSFKKCSASHSSDPYIKTRFQLVQPV